MNCVVCKQRYALAEPVTDKTGLVQPMCIECAAHHAKPAKFPEGTQRSGRLPHNDFANDERSAITRLLELHTAERDRLAHCLAEVLRMFRRVLAEGHSTAEQQQVLRDARAALEEVGL